MKVGALCPRPISFFHREVIVKTFYSLIFSLLCFGILGCTGKEAQVPRPTSQARLFMLDGDIKGLKQYRGKTTVVLFWATWCSYSRDSILDFNQFASRYRHRPDTAFLAISLDKFEDREAVEERVHYKNLSSVEHVFSGNQGQDEAYIKLKGANMPQFLVIDKYGFVVAQGDDIDVVADAFESRGIR